SLTDEVRCEVRSTSRREALRSAKRKQSPPDRMTSRRHRIDLPNTGGALEMHGSILWRGHTTGRTTILRGEAASWTQRVLGGDVVVRPGICLSGPGLVQNVRRSGCSVRPHSCGALGALLRICEGMSRHTVIRRVTRASGGQNSP